MAAEGLLSLAEGFAQEGCVLQAVKCLEAIVQSDTPFLPLIQATARVRLANLLLDHTDNPFKAKECLEQAQLLISDVPATLGLKLRLLSELGRYYMTTGEVSSQKMTAKRAMNLCTGGHLSMQADERALAVRWHAHFSLRMAASLVTEGSLQDAQLCIQGARGVQGSVAGVAPDPVVGALLSLSELQLLMQQDGADWGATGTGTGAGPGGGTGALVEQGLEVCRRDLAQVPEGPAAVQVRLHLLLLRTLTLLRRGDVESAGKAFEGISEKVFEALSLPPAYTWLSEAELWALVCLITVVVDRPVGKFGLVSTNVAKGLGVVEEAFGRIGMGPKSTEADLSLHTIWESRTLLYLKLLLHESSAMASLTQTDLEAAGQDLAAMVDLARRFPGMLREGAASVYLAAGLYCHTLGAAAEAERHYLAAAAASPRSDVQVACSVHAALAALCGEDPGAESRAHELLGPLSRSVDELPGLSQQAAVLFSSGLLDYRQGRAADAKSRLSRALKLSHKELMNRQLTAQVLYVLGPLMLATGDAGQASEMLTAGYALAKSAHDLPTQLAGFGPLADMYRAVGQGAKEQSIRESAQRRVDELARVVGGATAPGAAGAVARDVMSFTWPS